MASAHSPPVQPPPASAPPSSPAPLPVRPPTPPSARRCSHAQHVGGRLASFTPMTIGRPERQAEGRFRSGGADLRRTAGRSLRERHEHQPSQQGQLVLLPHPAAHRLIVRPPARTVTPWRRACSSDVTGAARARRAAAGQPPRDRRRTGWRRQDGARPAVAVAFAASSRWASAYVDLTRIDDEAVRARHDRRAARVRLVRRPAQLAHRSAGAARRRQLRAPARCRRARRWCRCSARASSRHPRHQPVAAGAARRVGRARSRRLAVPASTATPQSCPSVQLFLERCRDAGADVAADRPPRVVDLCRRLDGLPLAIEIAAARAHDDEHRRIAARLGSSVDVLDRPRFRGDPAPPQRRRHHPVVVRPAAGHRGRAASNSSRCSPARSPAARRGAVTSVDDPTVRRRSRRARRRGPLVTVDTSGPGTRYRLLDTVRRFALDRSAAGRAGSTYDRFADHVVTSVRRHGRGTTRIWRPGLSGT